MGHADRHDTVGSPSTHDLLSSCGGTDTPTTSSAFPTSEDASERLCVGVLESFSAWELPGGLVSKAPSSGENSAMYVRLSEVELKGWGQAVLKEVQPQQQQQQQQQQL